LRRQLEAERAKLEDGKPSKDLSKNLVVIQSQWREVIKDSPPLPQRMWRRAKKQLEGERNGVKTERENWWSWLMGGLSIRRAPNKQTSAPA
jgi:hypothetical protein